MKKEFICIVCPRGCRVVVDGDDISGNQCKRGIDYVKAEMTAPKRVLTTTVKTIFSEWPRVSVKTDKPLPKELLFKAMPDINKVIIDKPLDIGEVVIYNLCNTDVNLILTKSLKGVQK